VNYGMHEDDDGVFGDKAELAVGRPLKTFVRGDRSGGWESECCVDASGFTFLHQK